MSVQQLIFLLLAIVTIFSAIMVVSLRNILHSALWLVLTLLGVASLFALLGASFFAAVQILIYVGAIAILLIFAVMLTHNIMSVSDSQTNRGWGIAIVLVSIILIALISQFSTWEGFTTALIDLNSPGQETVISLGKGLVDPQGYALPFESASVLLLAALLGGVFIAFDKRIEKKS
jgi:NADH-quinone oxidoreductase subunit J